jgi:aminopeptidase N
LIDGSIYSYSSVPDAYRSYRDAVYLNGALFLEELRKLVGDETFFAFLKDYAGQNSGKIASRSSFFSILKSHTQVDLSPLMVKYFSSP